MNDSTTNPYLAFYGEHSISPVHQDVANMAKHLARRAKLYRTLGAPPALFQDRRVLEVGPGGGFNTLALFKWGATVDLVEPNPTARQELAALFAAHGIPETHWSLSPERIEFFPKEHAYPVVIAEGFIPALPDRAEVLRRLTQLTQIGGVLIVTCQDGISFFIELLKRMLAHRLIRTTAPFKERVALLAPAFASHLEAMPGASRPIEDWVADVLLAPTPFTGTFSMGECLQELDADFTYLGSSPCLFADCSWYKDLEAGTNAEHIQSFLEKRHMLILKDLPESRRSPEENQRLSCAIDALREDAGLQEAHPDTDKSQTLLRHLREIRELVAPIDPALPSLVSETMLMLESKDLQPSHIANAVHLRTAVGRAQQYLSLVRTQN